MSYVSSDHGAVYVVLSGAKNLRYARAAEILRCVQEDKWLQMANSYFRDATMGMSS